MAEDEQSSSDSGLSPQGNETVIQIDEQQEDQNSEPLKRDWEWFEGYLKRLKREATEDGHENTYFGKCRSRSSSEMELQALLDYVEQIHSRSQRLGHSEKLDRVFVFDISPTRDNLGEAPFNVTRQHDARSFKACMEEQQPTSVRIIAMPDLSPIAIDILGSTLDVNPHVFVNHIWSCNGHPFNVENSVSLDCGMVRQRAPRTLSIDSQCGRPWLPFCSKNTERFLQRNLRLVRHLATECGYPQSREVVFSVCRTTLNLIREENGLMTVLFLYVPPPGDDSPHEHEMFPLLWGLKHGRTTESLGLLGLSDKQTLNSLARNLLRNTHNGSKWTQILVWACEKALHSWNICISINKSQLSLLRHNDPKSLEMQTSLECLERINRETLEFIYALHARIRGEIEGSSKLILDKACSILSDRLKHLLDDIARDYTRHMENEQLRQARLQIRESKQAIQQNSIIRKLTILAFVFIPISAVSSIFGANVVELSSSPPRAWIMGVTIALVTFLSISIASFEFIMRLTYISAEFWSEIWSEMIWIKTEWSSGIEIFRSIVVILLGLGIAVPILSSLGIMFKSVQRIREIWDKVSGRSEEDD